MTIINRFVCFSSGFIVSLLFLIGSNVALAEDCIQKRTTPQAPDNIYKLVNPLGTNPENVSAGEKLYQKEAKPLACVQCHGVKGKGDGVMAKGMTPKPRDFFCSAMMKDIPDGQLFWVVKNGSKGTGMMPFGTLNDNQIWQVVSYIRRLSK
ncbi:MAG: c-type cytochrome [Nitrospinae bacterium]|nr:c-type cytochrome [Nitrospinota bacterium]